MRIELITDYYGYDGADYTKAQAVARATVLAGNVGVGSGYAPASDVRVESSAEVQESKTVGATWRQLFSRGNRASSLRFKVKPKYANAGAATEAAFALAIRSGLEGQLRVIPAPETENPVFVHPYNENEWFKENMRHAVIKRVKTRQIGVTVEAEYEIEF